MSLRPSYAIKPVGTSTVALDDFPMGDDEVCLYDDRCILRLHHDGSHRDATMAWIS